MMEENLELEFEVLEKQNMNVTTSMSDIYGYSVFSDTYLRSIEKGKAANRLKMDESLNLVFNGSRGLDTELMFSAVMQAEIKEIKKEETISQADTKDNALFMAAFGILGAGLTLGVILIVQKIFRRKRST